MPVTARLSKLFYDRLGEAVANELVDWFNQVDATYRSDLREMNELNFARFDAKLEQRLVTLEARIEQRMAALEQGIAALGQRIGGIESRLDAKIHLVEARFEARMEAQTAKLMRFFFVAWAAQMAAIFGVWFR